MRNLTISILLIHLILILATANAYEVVCYDDFEGGNPSATKLTYGTTLDGLVLVSSDTSKNYNGSLGSLVGTYPVNSTGGSYVYGGCDIATLNLNDIYIEFRAKMPDLNRGMKFLKVHGQEPTDGNYSNTTFGLSYNDGTMKQVSFGDGSGVGNDTTQVIELNGEDKSLIGRSYGTASVITPQNSAWGGWDNSWHHFRIHVKYNSGTTAANEVADGEYYVEVDNVVYVDAKGLFNRHYTNSPIDHVGIFGWAQFTNSTPVELWYDDFIVTTGDFYSQTPVPSESDVVVRVMSSGGVLPWKF